MEKITFEGEVGEKLNLYIMESTRLAGVDYILAADVPTGDGDCYILADRSEPDAEEAVYEMVEDEKMLDYLLSVFAELMDDVDFEF
ncbi:MAG: DUF1292 domain-containing protein [Lachnospiraceae bacterium]|nr:DUF1292 domain-containing protein [Lachnospiraceae bacterium]